MADHARGRLAGWILLALAGLAVAVALSVTASNLSTQPIGLSGEPLRAGDKLAPASAKPRRNLPPQTQTTPSHAPTTTTPSTGGGSGKGDNDSDDHGRGGHHDGDDD